jgi:predicted nuclease of predicted toxin-antitoxin system
LRLLVDRCAGRKLAEWLREQEHDVLQVRTLGRDPGDAALLRLRRHGQGQPDPHRTSRSSRWIQ